MRVAILCHFSNPIVRDQLYLQQATARNGVKYKDFAEWISNILAGLKGNEDLDIHVISPHVGMCQSSQAFMLEGIHYYFFRKELLYPWGGLENRYFPQAKRNFPRNRRAVKSFIKQIQPDLVLLIGAENAYYSIAGLDVKGIPMMIHLQTVYANPDRMKNTGRVDKQRWDVEVQLFRRTPYIACTGRMYYDLVKSYNPQAIVFPRCWPVHQFPSIPDVEKKYDFVYFARQLNKNKGFENALEAMAGFIALHPEAHFLTVGAKEHEWSRYELRIKELKLENNLEVHPPFPEYVDLLKYVKQARFALLPISMDVLSGTIIESMRMGMPVVTCRTSGTPSLNVKRKTVLISDIGDIEGLTKNMFQLYETPSLQEELRKNAELYIKENDKANKDNVKIMIDQFKAVIEHYNNGTPIPQELLYNTDENKDYRKE